MSIQLPPNPHLELLRRRAKELLHAARSGDEPALARLHAAVPRLAPALDGAAQKPRLADAQHAIARELGVASWPKLVREVARRQPLDEQAARFLAAIRDGRDAVARRIVGEHPAIRRTSVLTAAVLGDAELVAAVLRAAPAVANGRHAETGWTPLDYAAASPFHADDAATAHGILRTAELLLDAGADANTATIWEGPEGESPIPVLYRACVADHVALVGKLLERGADPNDGESIHHAAELDHRGCLEQLLAHGADLSSRHPRWGNTPLYFLAGWKEFHPRCASATRGMAWLLEHGADPNVASGEVQETPLHRVAAYGRGAAVVDLLLDHGARVDSPRADGRTPYVLAVRAGNLAAAERLAARGADPSRLAPVDAFLGACQRGDGDAASRLAAAQPGIAGSLVGEDRHGLALAAEEGREASVRVMVELGFDLAWEGAWGGTPLHHAAWHGRPAMVRLLLALGAPVNVRDSVYGSSPLAWTAHGSQHAGRTGDEAQEDYVAIVDLLLEAGADRATSINRWDEPPESMATRQVSAALRRRGFVS